MNIEHVARFHGRSSKMKGQVNNLNFINGGHVLGFYLTKWYLTITIDYSKFTPRLQNDPLCIPLCGNSVCILSITSECIGIFKLNCAVLIQVLAEAI